MLATRQHGVVARRQLVALGFSATAILRRVSDGRLHPVHRGVYAVGYRRISAKGRWLAAVLACGADAVLSHRAAVALWQLRPRQAGPIDVTVPGRSKRGKPGIRVHNVRELDARDRRVVDGIPVTSVHRFDSWVYHRSRHAFENDRRRDVTLQLAGWRVLRFADQRMKKEPAAVVAAIRQLLDAPAAA